MIMDEKSISVREYMYNDDKKEKLSISFISKTKTRLAASKSSESRSPGAQCNNSTLSLQDKLIKPRFNYFGYHKKKLTHLGLTVGTPVGSSLIGLSLGAYVGLSSLSIISLGPTLGIFVGNSLGPLVALIVGLFETVGDELGKYCGVGFVLVVGIYVGSLDEVMEGPTDGVYVSIIMVGNAVGGGIM